MKRPIGKPWYRTKGKPLFPFIATGLRPISRMGYVHFGSLFLLLPLGGYLVLNDSISPETFMIPFALWFLIPIFLKTERSQPTNH